MTISRKQEQLLNNIHSGYQILVDTLVNNHDQKHQIAYYTISVINKSPNKKKAIQLLSDSYQTNRTTTEFLYDYYNRVFETTQRKPLEYFQQRSPKTSGQINSYNKLEDYLYYIIAKAIYRYFNQKTDWSQAELEEIEDHIHVRCQKNRIERNMSGKMCQQIKHKHKHITTK